MGKEWKDEKNGTFQNAASINNTNTQKSRGNTFPLCVQIYNTFNYFMAKWLLKIAIIPSIDYMLCNIMPAYLSNYLSIYKYIRCPGPILISNIDCQQSTPLYGFSTTNHIGIGVASLHGLRRSTHSPVLSVCWKLNAKIPIKKARARERFGLWLT